MYKKLEKRELDDGYIFEMARRIVEKAAQHGILLRLLGATAFVSHCPQRRDLFARLGRKLTDIDLITYSSYKATAVEKALSELGLERQRHYVWHAEYREIYTNEGGLFVDVFRDSLSFSHEIRLKGRLELDSPTIPLEDLLLEKLQIHHITEKDFKDVIILLLEHDLGVRGDRERIDLRYLTSLLSDDWGFYYDAVENLKKIKGFLEGSEKNPGDGYLSEEETGRVRGRINLLIDAVEEEPKTLRWQRRAKKGTKKAWYNEVGEIQQGV